MGDYTRGYAPSVWRTKRGQISPLFYRCFLFFIVHTRLDGQDVMNYICTGHLLSIARGRISNASMGVST